MSNLCYFALQKKRSSPPCPKQLPPYAESVAQLTTQHAPLCCRSTRITCNLYVDDEDLDDYATWCKHGKVDQTSAPVYQNHVLFGQKPKNISKPLLLC